eukprot:5164061-Amphidinium_carterae.1
MRITQVAVNRVLDMKLASFFDPNDPCNDINTLFDRFKHSADMPYLRIGIVYGWKDVLAISRDSRPMFYPSLWMSFMGS